MIQLRITRTEMVDHDEGFTTMRLHVELPNGAHYFIDEDDWHVIASMDEGQLYAEMWNDNLAESNMEVRVAQLIDSDGTTSFLGQGIFTLIDVTELELSEGEQYAFDALQDGIDDEQAAVNADMYLNRPSRRL